MKNFEHAELDRLAREITVRDSMVYLDGADYTGMGPGLRTESTDKLMVTYLTDIRGERVLILQASWFGPLTAVATGPPDGLASPCA